jgi:hypothetical protein
MRATQRLHPPPPRGRSPAGATFARGVPDRGPKLGQTPGGDRPRTSDGANMMREDSDRTALRHIGEIRPFRSELEILRVPASRVIGIEQSYRLHGGDRAAAPQWARVLASEEWRAIAALPRVVSDSCFGGTCGYTPETESFGYLVAVLTPASTPVPEGCQFRDAPPTLAAAGPWGEPMDQVAGKMRQLGYVPRYGDKGCEWNAELYLDEEEHLPASNGQEWRWLLPCRREDTE